MAGKGPAPKDPSQRRNHHPPQRGEWVDLPPLEKTVLPELPELVDEDWAATTRLTWAAWRSDPVTSQYTPADVAYALDTIRLYDTGLVGKAEEVRRRMDGLGLTPKGKRDLRWRVAEKPSERSASRELPQDVSDRRARLTVVQ